MRRSSFTHGSRVLALLLLLAAVPAGAATGVEVAVIAHPAVAQDSLGKTQLLDYYTGDIQRWPDGTRVVVTDLKAKGAVRDGFYEFLGKRPSRLKSIWLRRMLSGEGEPPVTLGTEDEVVARVAATRGAIGYVGRDRVTPDVRVLLWIEVRPGADAAGAD